MGLWLVGKLICRVMQRHMIILSTFVFLIPFLFRCDGFFLWLGNYRVGKGVNIQLSKIWKHIIVGSTFIPINWNASFFKKNNITFPVRKTNRTPATTIQNVSFQHTGTAMRSSFSPPSSYMSKSRILDPECDFSTCYPRSLFITSESPNKFHGYIPDTAARKRRSKMDKKKVNCVPVIGVLWSFSLIVLITTFHCDGIIFITSILGGGTGRTIFVTNTGILCGGIDLSLQDHPASPSGSFSSRPFSGEASTSGVTAP